MVNETPEHIMKTPGVCGGRARIAGHRVRVHDIVGWSEQQGMTPDEIVSHVPSITLSDVHYALAYYFDHVEEIRGEMRADRAFVEEMRQKYPSTPDAKLRRQPLADVLKGLKDDQVIGLDRGDIVVRDREALKRVIETAN